ncbi:MAG: GGDEF domain-containing protein [Gammaproteobacteria bacterium]
MKRTFKEYILLAVPTVGMIGVFPFVILQFIRSQWLMGTVDAAIVLGFGLVALYVWMTRKVRIPSIVLTVFTLCATVAVIYINGPSLIYWAFPTMTAAYFLLKPGEAATANMLALFVLIPVISMNLEYLEFVSILITIILNNIFSYVFSINMQEHQEKLVTQATRDALTGAGNRRLFDEDARESIAFLKRSEVTTTLILLDIDHFKNINDAFGHATGDQVVINLTKLFRLRLRHHISGCGCL